MPAGCVVPRKWDYIPILGKLRSALTRSKILEYRGKMPLPQIDPEKFKELALITDFSGSGFQPRFLRAVFEPVHAVPSNMI
jgi:hypothetical protein